MAVVLLPCDLPTWPAVQRLLIKIQRSQEPDQLVEIMHQLHNICNIGLYPEEDCVDPTRFDQFRLYLLALPSIERGNIFTTVLPSMVEFALNLAVFKPRDGLHYALQQQDSCTSLNISLVASLIAHSFFSTFPRRTALSHPTLGDCNFSGFFQYLDRSWQRAKLQAVFVYFETLSKADPTGYIHFTRQVMSGQEVSDLQDWLTCTRSMCPVVVKDTGWIEDAEPGVCQVCFLSTPTGGDILTGGQSQETLGFPSRPEMLVSTLFQEKLENNEALHVNGAAPVTRIQINDSDVPSVHIDQLSTQIDWEVCGVDAERSNHQPELQYDDDAVLRELNKALAGFQKPGMAKKLSTADVPKLSSPKVSISSLGAPAGLSNYLARRRNGSLTGSKKSLLSPTTSHSLDVTSSLGCEAAPHIGRESTFHTAEAARRSRQLKHPGNRQDSTGNENKVDTTDRRENILSMISHLQVSIEQEHTDAFEDANPQSISQTIQSIKSMPRNRLVSLLSEDVEPSDEYGRFESTEDDRTIRDICRNLLPDPSDPLVEGWHEDPKIDTSVNDFVPQDSATAANISELQTRLEELVGSSTPCDDVPQHQPFLESDAFFSLDSSLDRSSISSVAERSSVGSPPLFRGSISPEHQSALIPRRRRTFQERLREANMRARCAEFQDEVESSSLDDSGEISQTAERTRSRASQAGALCLIEGVNRERRCSTSSRSVTCHPTRTTDSSPHSLSTEFSTDMEDLCEKFSLWLDDPVTSQLTGRDLAVLRLTHQMLRRTLSDTYADVINSVQHSHSGLSRRASDDSLEVSRAREQLARSTSLNVRLARHRLALEISRKLIDTAHSTELTGNKRVRKKNVGSVVKIIQEVDRITMGSTDPVTPHPAAIYRYSEELVSQLLPASVQEGAMHLDFHAAKHRRAYRKDSRAADIKETSFLTYQDHSNHTESKHTLYSNTAGILVETLAPVQNSDAVVGFSRSLVECMLEETYRQLLSPRKLLLKRLTSGRAQSLDRKGILKKKNHPASSPLSRNLSLVSEAGVADCQLAAQLTVEAQSDVTVSRTIAADSGDCSFGGQKLCQRAIFSHSVPVQLHQLGEITEMPAAAASVRRKSRRELFQELHRVCKVASAEEAAVEPVWSQPSVDRPVPSGSWGYGARGGGDPQLKAIVQWLAASHAKVPCLVFYTAQHPTLQKLPAVYQTISDKHWSVGELAALTLSYCQKRLEATKSETHRKDDGFEDLFHHLMAETPASFDSGATC